MNELMCPSCGNALPEELGQHASNLVVGLVTCPHCGAEVTLDKGPHEQESAEYERAVAAPPGQEEGRNTFSGNDTVAEVAEELSDKPT